MSQKPGIFPTFFLSGFECSTFVWKDQGRRNLIHETRHREHAAEDYAMLRKLGIAVAGEWLHNGICDLVPDEDDLRRVADDAYVEELRRWQRLLNRVTELDEDPFSDPVELADVIAAAKKLKMRPDKNWT
jgi:hypothetical protein